VGAVDAHRIIRRVVAHQGINAQQVEVPLSRWVERASQPQADSATSKSWHWPADAMTANTAPLVTREALQAFTQRLVKHFAPEQVILFGSQARGEARWDSDADILVVMSFEGRPQDSEKTMRNTCEPAFPLDLHLRRPQEIAPRYRWGDPFIREALNHGVMLHGEGLPDALCPGDGGPVSNVNATPGARVHTPTRNPVVNEWIARAERHWRMAEQLADLTISYQSGLFLAQLCLETYLRAALIAQGVDSRKCRDLQILSDRLRVPIPGWQPNPETLNTLTQGAIAYLHPCEGHPEPTQDGAWAIAHAGPLRACLRGWFDSLDELN
jgi:predicted nucleotidyltransferase